jgi:hypothetical protein
MALASLTTRARRPSKRAAACANDKPTTKAANVASPACTAFQTSPFVESRASDFPNRYGNSTKSPEHQQGRDWKQPRLRRKNELRHAFVFGPELDTLSSGAPTGMSSSSLRL